MQASACRNLDNQHLAKNCLQSAVNPDGGRCALRHGEWIALIAGRLEYFRRILLPLLKPTMVSVAIIVFISAVRDIPTVIFLSTHETCTLSLLMLDYIVEANQEKAAVFGVLLVFLIFGFLLIGRLFWLSKTLRILTVIRQSNRPDFAFMRFEHVNSFHE